MKKILTYLIQLIVMVALLQFGFANVFANTIDYVPDPADLTGNMDAYDPDKDGVLAAPNVQFTHENFQQAQALTDQHLMKLEFSIGMFDDKGASNCGGYLFHVQMFELAPKFVNVPTPDQAAVNLYSTQTANIVRQNQPLANSCRGDQVIDQHMKDVALASINGAKQASNDLAPVVEARTGQVVGNGSAASCNEGALQSVVNGGGTITFNCGGNAVIPISKRIMITQDTVIDGGGQITLDGQNSSAILGSEERLTVGIKNMTIQNGFSAEQGAGFNVGFWSDLTVENVVFSNNVSTAEAQLCDGGGALFIGGGGVANIQRSQFIGNSANNGGAINNLRTRLTINLTTFENNTAMHTPRMAAFGDCGGGGAVYFDGTRKPEDGGPDEVVWTNNKFINNTTNNHGGAVFFGIRSGEQVYVSDSVFQGNVAQRVQGREQTGTGGAFWLGPGVGGTGGFIFSMERVSFIGNHADFQGGGLWTRSAVELTNVTFAENTAINPAISDRGNWRRGFGGALVGGDQALVYLNNVTVVNNRSGFNGGGISGENIHASNSIIANNVGEWDMGLQQNCTHFVNSRGNNLQYLLGHPSADHAHQSNCGPGATLGNPMVGELGFYGGPQRVIPLMPNSMAVNTGNMATCAPTDQRGTARPSGLICDLGAFELAGDTVAPATSGEPPSEEAAAENAAAIQQNAIHKGAD